MKSLEDLKRIRDSQAQKLGLRDQKNGFRVVVGMGTCGIAAGARSVLNSLVSEVSDKRLDNVTVTQVGCMGECALEPLVEVFDSNGNRTTYCHVDDKSAKKLINNHVVNGEVVKELLITNFKK